MWSIVRRFSLDTAVRPQLYVSVAKIVPRGG